MGLFSFIKKQMLKVIEWKEDGASDVIVHRFDTPDRYAIMKGTQLIVRETQVAIFVNEGVVADVFTPGRYKLDTHNLPVLTALCNWKYAFENPYVGEVYFVSTKQFAGLKWGTQNPIMMRDKDFGMIRLRGFGAYAFRVSEPKVFMKELLGTSASYHADDIKEYLKKIIVSGLADYIAESGLSALDLAMRYDELGEGAKEKLQDRFFNMGLSLTNLIVENLSLPEEVEKTMDTRTSMGVLSDKMGTFTQYQSAMAMREAANNEGGAGGAGMGIGAGFGLGNMMMQNMQGMNTARDDDRVSCSNCGEKIEKGAKFCPSCGKKTTNGEICPKCGKEVEDGAKFCQFCGESLVKTCPKCGKTVKGAFCSECGSKL